MAFFIVTGVKTSNLTYGILLLHDNNALYKTAIMHQKMVDLPSLCSFETPDLLTTPQGKKAIKH
jgi:hypothetical protein